MSLWTENEEIFRTLYLSETDSNIPLLEAINPLWHPLEIPPNFSEAHKEKKKLIEGSWRIVLAWIIKERLKIFNDDDYPFTSTVYKELKPWALFLNAQLNLCEGCFDMFPAGHLPYTSGVQWWQATLWERKLYSISNIPKEPFLNDKNNYKKRGLVDNTMRRKLALMKGMRNPFPPHDSDVQHHRELIAATFAIIKTLLSKSESGSEDSDIESDRKECQNFRKKYWEPYKRVYQD